MQMPDAELALLIAQSSSKHAVLASLGFKCEDWRAYKYLSLFIERNHVDTTHFKSAGRPVRYTVEEVIDAVQQCTNISQVLRKLGLSEVGGNARTIKNLIEKHQISTVHFTSARIGVTRSSEDILCKNSTASRTVVRHHIIVTKAIPHVCQMCNNSGVWNSTKLTLELDHINGDRTNNEVSNLRFLCPNCHSQTPTFRGKNNTARDA
jgi:5-methylcytosine-specific restriction endonuclease McrA